MATKKPNKFDLRVRWMKTQAVEVDCPVLAERNIMSGRIGEYINTHEFFVPGNMVKQLGKAFRDPVASGAIMGAVNQIVESLGQYVAVRTGVDSRAVQGAVRAGMGFGTAGAARTPPPPPPRQASIFDGEPPFSPPPPVPSAVPCPEEPRKPRKSRRKIPTS